MKRSLLLLLFTAVQCSLYAQSDNFIHASWISPGYTEDTLRPACPVFIRDLRLSKPIRNASLLITAHGLYEAVINGRKIGAGYLTPGYTHYHKRLQFQRYDVTKMLHTSVNRMEVTIADGWYRGVFGGDMQRNNYGRDASLLLQLDLTYADGTKQSIVSDSSWQCGAGPIRYSDLYEGETVDTRAAASRGPVSVASYTNDNLVETSSPAVTTHESFLPRRIWQSPNGQWLIDFGQNLAGWVQIKIKGRPGDTIRLYHAELLDTAGNFYTGNLREAKASDTYILNGTEQTLHPRFTYHGFRFVRAEGFDPRKAALTAVALYSDLPQTGSFSCSDTLLNQLQQNISWSLKSNFVDIPTDCPQRSERLGWTGDAQIFCPTAAFNRDVRTFFGKWLSDLAACQDKYGGLPNIIPNVYDPLDTLVKAGAAGWGDAAVIIPWRLYEIYADTPLLARQYPSMKARVDYITSKSPDGLWKARGYGDWYALGDSTSLPFIDQCFYIHSTELLIRAAKILDNPTDADIYTSLLAKIRQSFLSTYGQLDTKATSTQTAFVLALQFDLLPEEQRQAVAERLAEKIRENKDHLATGFLGTPYLLPVLSRYGHAELAYTLLLQKTCPSWLYPITRGATTIWERWDAIRPDGSIQQTSFNHYSYGAVGQWMYTTIAGIRAVAPGYREIRIAPVPGGGLTWAKASYRCPYGEIVSEWKITGGQTDYHIVIPAGTNATIELPGQPEKKVGPGTYNYAVK